MPRRLRADRLHSWACSAEPPATRQPPSKPTPDREPQKLDDDARFETCLTPYTRDQPIQPHHNPRSQLDINRRSAPQHTGPTQLCNHPTSPPPLISSSLETPSDSIPQSLDAFLPFCLDASIPPCVN